MSTVPQRRRKPTTYGKASGSASAWNVTNWDASDDDELSAPKPTALRNKTVRESYHVQKSESKPQASEPIQERAKKEDAWDVPSSDDEIGNSVARYTPRKLLPNRKLADVEVEQDHQLAPWEKQKATPTQSQDDSMAANAQLVSDIERTALEMVAKVKRKLPTPHHKPIDTSAVSEQTASAGLLSAAERLKQRKRFAGDNPSPQKVSSPRDRIRERVEDETIDANPTPQKRPRSNVQLVEHDRDMAMEDVPPPLCDSSTQEASPKVSDEFELSDSSTDHARQVNRQVTASKRTQSQIHTGRYQLKTKPQSATTKMDSAPARLSNLAPPVTETADSSYRSPSATSSRPTTPRCAVKADGHLTPKQALLWDAIMDDEVSAPSPSGLPMQDLTLKSSRRSTAKPTVLSRSLLKSSTDVGPARRRTKLVDRLKASAPSLDGDSSGNESGSEQNADGVQTSSDDSASQESRTRSHSQSQSQSQSALVVEPRITYSRVRSYLPEDSFEDGLLLGLQPDPPQQPTPVPRRTTNKTHDSSQRSAFDLDDSDDEGTTGRRIRTIHELRAGGGNQRFMDETSSILDDIADHNASGRSRRRSALIELAKKLSDKAFSERFFRQSFEQQLLAECENSPDDVADFALAAAIAILLSRDPPDHVAQSIKDGPAIAWLVRQTQIHTDAKQAAKDRRNNMAKAAQSTFVGFATAIADDKTLWNEEQGKPATVLPCTLALKALDQVVRKLRLSGDGSTILDINQLQQLMPSKSDIDALQMSRPCLELTLAVSVMESSATNVAEVSWPTEVVERVGDLLVSPSLAEDGQHHLRFLVLRLCTWLTNGNAKNCDTLAKSTTVPHLFHNLLEAWNKHSAEMDSAKRLLNLDVLVIITGVLINLTSHSESARAASTTGETAMLLTDLVVVFRNGHKRMLEADTVEDTESNIPLGYLAVALANLCMNSEAKRLIAEALPGKNLNTLIETLAEFTIQHQKVDRLGFGGEGDVEVWSAFTETLKNVLYRLRRDA